MEVLCSIQGSDKILTDVIRSQDIMNCAQNSRYCPSIALLFISSHSP